jgi:hypothetical protein
LKGKIKQMSMNLDDRRQDTEQQWQRNVTQARNNLPTISFWGEDAAFEYVDKLTAILGPDGDSHTTQTFCQSNQCSPQEMTALLKRDWVVHNIQKVERGEEKAGLLPLVLIQSAGNYYSVSLYSPTRKVRKECYPNMPNTNELTYQQLEELSRILGREQFYLVEEDEFCNTVECQLEHIEEHIDEYWVDHDIRAVLAGLEFVPQPTVVLVRYRDELVTWRVITLRDADARRRCLENQ